MRRHLLGLSAFILIVGISIAVYSFVRSITRLPDIGSVRPVVEVEDVPVSPIAQNVRYVTRLVQYDHRSRLLIARLEVDREEIGSDPTVDIRVAVDGSEAGFRGHYFPAIGKVLLVDGQRAVLLVEKVVPDSLNLNSDNNHYAAFRIARNEDSLANLTPKDFGPESPIVFVHPRTSIKTPTSRGADILQ